LIAQGEAQKAEGEKMMAEQEKAIAREEEKMRETCLAHGVDYDKMKQDAEAKKQVRPRVSAKEQMDQLNSVREVMKQEGVENPEIERALDDPELYERFQDAERRVDDMYRKQAHFFGIPQPLSPADNEKVKTELLAAQKE